MEATVASGFPETLPRRSGRPSRTLARFAIGMAALLAVFLASPAIAAACSAGWMRSDLEDQLMCPTCHVPLNQSDSLAAQRIRRYVAQRCRAGWSEQQTKQALVDQFGAAILAAPPYDGFGALAWLVPALLLVAGATVAAILVRAWARRHAIEPMAPAQLSDDLAERIDAQLREFE